MPLTNYTELQAAIADWANRTDLPVKDLIKLAEARIWRHPGFQNDYYAGDGTGFTPPDALVVAPGQLYVPLEETQLTDWSVDAVHEAWIEGYEDGRLEKVPPHTIAAINAQDGGKQGRPRYYAVAQFPGYPVIAGGVEWKDYLWMYLAPKPDQYYTISVFGSTNISLSDAKPSTWLLRKYPDVYLYGALAEAEAYLKNDERIPVWEKRFLEAMDELKRHHDRVAWSGVHTMPQRVAMGES